MTRVAACCALALGGQALFVCPAAAQVLAYDGHVSETDGRAARIVLDGPGPAYLGQPIHLLRPLPVGGREVAVLVATLEALWSEASTFVVVGADPALPAGVEAGLRVQVEWPDAPGTVEITSRDTTVAAEVRWRGHRLGDTPLILEALPGTYDLVLSAPCYVPATPRVTVPAGQHVALAHPFRPARSASDLLGDTERKYNSGRYGEAQALADSALVVTCNPLAENERIHAGYLRDTIVQAIELDERARWANLTDEEVRDVMADFTTVRRRTEAGPPQGQDATTVQAALARLRRHLLNDELVIDLSARYPAAPPSRPQR